MKKIFSFVVILFLTGCLKSPNIINSTLSSLDLKPTIQKDEKALGPCLPPNVPVKIYVEDKRPKVETEKVPTTDFVYSGALFNLENNRSDISEDLGQMAIKFGGAKIYQIVNEMPKQGPAIILILENWYSKIPKIQENKSYITVYGVFAGEVMMKYDDAILASTNFKEEGLPTIVSTYIKKEKEKQETPTLIWNAMLAKANSAQQKAYLDVFDFLEQNWPKFNKK
jgi:hypothetical protein